MILWASVESEFKAYDKLKNVWRLLEPYLNEKFKNSILNHLEMKLRYVPIVMDPESIKNYPERSRALVKKRIYDCAPQLKYETFVYGNLTECLDEYLRGISLSSPHLRKFGATPEQVREFDAIIASARQDIISEMGGSSEIAVPVH